MINSSPEPLTEFAVVITSRPLAHADVRVQPVGDNLISMANFIGVELRPIPMEAGIQRGASQLHTTSIDGWTAGTATEVVMEPDAVRCWRSG